MEELVGEEVGECGSSGSCYADTPNSSTSQLQSPPTPGKALVTTTKRKNVLAEDQCFIKKPNLEGGLSQFSFDASGRSPPPEEDLPLTPSSTSSEPSPAVEEWLGEFQSLSVKEKLDALTSLVRSCNISEIRHLHQTIQPYFQKDFISLLPKELSLYILSMLDARDLLSAAQTCGYWCRIAEDHLLWRERCQEAGLKLDSLPPSPSAFGPVYYRSRWKSLFLRNRRIGRNWRVGLRALEEQKTLRGHEDHVITCLEIRGNRIVSGSDDNTLRIWSATSGECIMSLTGHTGGVWSSQMSEDGSRLVSGSTDRSIKVWDAHTGECLHTFLGHTSTVRCMVLRGNTLVTGSRDTTLRVWDIESGEQLHKLTGHVAAVRCVQFDGKRVISGAYDYTVKVWDVETEQCVHNLLGHTNRVYSLQFDSERDLVISGSLDTSIRVWDVGRGLCLHTLTGHQSLTSGMQLRGRTLVSGNADSTVKVWDVVEGHCQFTLAGPHRHTSAVTSLQFLSNGLVVTSSDDGTVKLWDVKQGSFVRDLVRLGSMGSGGCIWRIKATPTTLVCAVGSRNGTEDTKLVLLDFNADFP